MRPEIGTQAQFRKKKGPFKYRYDSSLDPAMSWDEGQAAREEGEAYIRQILEADTIEVAKAAAAKLKAMSAPFLNWSGKAEKAEFDIPTLPLFMHEKISETLDGFKHFQGVYERDLVDAAIELKEEITPHLMAVLENLISNPNKYTENPDLFDHTYAVMLLGHFGEARAHKTLVDVFSLPNRMSDDLFGDIVTEDLPMILLRTCNGSLEHIKAMALNKNADDYCRASALHAMAYATIANIATREEVLAFYGSLFSGQEADKDSDLWGLLACLVYELYPEELMDTISKAFEDGLINPGIIDYQSFERALRRDKNSHLEDLRKDFKRKSLDNIHDSMSWWACFDPEPEDPFPMDYPPAGLTGVLSNKSQKQKRAKKKKRKISKASEKKNHR